jgi:hypothetical protein
MTNHKKGNSSKNIKQNSEELFDVLKMEYEKEE